MKFVTAKWGSKLMTIFSIFFFLFFCFFYTFCIECRVHDLAHWADLSMRRVRVVGFFFVFFFIFCLYDCHSSLGYVKRDQGVCQKCAFQHCFHVCLGVRVCVCVCVAEVEQRKGKKSSINRSTAPSSLSKGKCTLSGFK